LSRQLHERALILKARPVGEHLVRGLKLALQNSIHDVLLDLGLRKDCQVEDHLWHAALPLIRLVNPAVLLHIAHVLRLVHFFARLFDVISNWRLAEQHQLVIGLKREVHCLWLTQVLLFDMFAVAAILKRMPRSALRLKLYEQLGQRLFCRLDAHHLGRRVIGEIAV
jgi:hypothetical protein